MKNSILSLITLLAAVVITAASSCVKDEASGPCEDILVGKWKGYMVGIYPQSTPYNALSPGEIFFDLQADNTGSFQLEGANYQITKWSVGRNCNEFTFTDHLGQRGYFLITGLSDIDGGLWGDMLGNSFEITLIRIQ